MTRTFTAAVLLAMTASASAQTVSPSAAMVTEWNRPTYTFEPKDDVTASELAKALVVIMPAFVCRNALGHGCDPTEAIEALPDNTKRHFVKHGGTQ
jgi:hypothetical protein